VTRAASLAALLALAVAPLGCSAAPTDTGGTESADTEGQLPPLHDRAFYEAIASGAGVTLHGQPVVVGLRGMSREGVRHEVRTQKTFDDVLAVLKQDGTVVELHASTHPWFTTSTAAPDVDGDGRGDVGMIKPGRYHAVPRPGRLLAGEPTFHILTPDGSDRLPGWRDTNHDGIYDDGERTASDDRHDVITAVLFHEGGPAAPAPIGCQVLDAVAIKDFIADVGGSGAEIDYVLADAP
jgi:hypothetical protein